MSGEQRFQGYSLDRNSSKVMAPPGGVSSISFGGYEEPAPARKAAPAPAPAQAAAAPAPAAPAAAAAAPSDSGAPAGPIAGQRVVHVDRFEKDHSTSACQMNRNKSTVFGGNTPPPTNNKRTTVKLHAPPGGASSITFG